MASLCVLKRQRKQEDTELDVIYDTHTSRSFIHTHHKPSSVRFRRIMYIISTTLSMATMHRTAILISLALLSANAQSPPPTDFRYGDHGDHDQWWLGFVAFMLLIICIAAFFCLSPYPFYDPMPTYQQPRVIDVRIVNNDARPPAATQR